MGMASTAVSACVAEPDFLVAHAKELTAENGEIGFVCSTRREHA